MFNNKKQIKSTTNNKQPTTNYQQLLVGRFKLAVGNYRLLLRHAFTLVEVLIVVGLIAVLSTVVLLTLNPLDFLKQGRDSTRLNDLSNLVRTLNYIQAESPQTFFGNPKTIYISRPDPNLTGDATSTCPNMNLPPIPSDWSYYCVSKENLSRIDGKGWIPIDFSKQAIFRLSKLPTDPKNNENYYYTYVYDPNTQTFEIDTALESQKQKHLLSEDNGDNNNLYELGTNLTLYPIGSIGQNFALKNESSQLVKNESNFAIYVAQAAGTGQVSFFIAPDQVTGDNNFFWDNTNKRLGIWTTSPASKLSVSGGVSIGSTYAGTTAPTDGLIVQGNVGIGTTGPSGLLDVGGGQLVVTSGGNVGIGTTNPVSGYKMTINGDLILGTATTYNSSMLRVGYIAGVAGAGGFLNLRPGLSSGAVIFSSSAGSELVRITNAGNVGIGTTTPTALLHIASSTSAIINLEKTGTTANVSYITNDGELRIVSGRKIYLQAAAGHGIYLRKGTTDILTLPWDSNNVGIGTTTPAYKLDVFGDIRTTGCLVYNGGTLGTCASDIRLKDNIMNLTFDNAIEKVIKLQPKKFVFKQDPNHEIHGLIAQEVEEFAPELVTTDQNGYKQIKYGDIQWLMLQTIQEQQKQIDELKHRVEILEKGIRN
jgi:prepilin-type N-terminal cleavage/methylation domain-containing protein